MNKVILMGRLTRDPEVQNGSVKCTRYTLAVAKNKDAADFFSCVAFDKNADFAEKYLHKGTKILIDGRLSINSWADKDGKPHKDYQIIVDSHHFCESAKASN